MNDQPARPQTPQPMLHRLPDKLESASEPVRLSRYIVILSASTAFAGKVLIAKSVADALSCPLYQGDSLHETCAKAASVVPLAPGNDTTPGRNETRYQRMWLSKMTRTGLLFPEASQPATLGFSGFGGAASTSTSRRGSDSSIGSVSTPADSTTSSSLASSFTSSPANKEPYVNKPSAISYQSRQSSEDNRLVLVITHPKLDTWHKRCIQSTLDDYGIGVIFVPLDKDNELPVLKPLDPRTITSLDQSSQVHRRDDSTITLRVEAGGKVEETIGQIVYDVKEFLCTSS
jgi:hypothetical protein